MKKILLTSAIVLSTFASNAASPYVSIKAGYANNTFEHSSVGGYFYKDTGFDGFAGSAAAGLAFDVDPAVTLRGELAYSYTSVSNDDFYGLKIATVSNTLMLNVYADLGAKSWAVRPYVGAGLGHSFGNKLDVDDGALKVDADNGLAYAGMIGAAWYVTSGLAIDLELKYKVLNNVDTTVTYFAERTSAFSTSVMLGARYTF